MCFPHSLDRIIYFECYFYGANRSYTQPFSPACTSLSSSVGFACLKMMRSCSRFVCPCQNSNKCGWIKYPPLETFETCHANFFLFDENWFWSLSYQFGNGTIPSSPNFFLISSSTSSKYSRHGIGWLCGLAAAPIYFNFVWKVFLLINCGLFWENVSDCKSFRLTWLARGRSWKYFSDASRDTFEATPSILTWRRSGSQ